jgi:hypothetical protein
VVSLGGFEANQPAMAAVITDGIWSPLSATTVEWKLAGDSNIFTIWTLGSAGL